MRSVLNKLTDYLLKDTIIDNIISGVVGGIILAVFVFIFRHTILAAIKRVLPQLQSKVPYINYEIEYRKGEDGEWFSEVLVSNAGNEPAYNLYVYYFEQFAGENFRITASVEDQAVKRPVLGVRDKLRFTLEGVEFIGCNATCDQEIWIEYENSSGVNFRVVHLPPSPRGDEVKVLPPKVIKKRIERFPGILIEGNKKEAEKYKKGKKSIHGEVRLLKNVQFWLRRRIY